MPGVPKPDARTILVAGDLTIDWNIACTRSSESRSLAWTAEDSTRAYWQRGGVALLSDLVEAVANQLRKSGQAMYEVRQVAAPREPIHPGDPRYHHSYAMWSLFKSGAHPSLGTANAVWRVEEFLFVRHRLWAVALRLTRRLTRYRRRDDSWIWRCVTC